MSNKSGHDFLTQKALHMALAGALSETHELFVARESWYLPAIQQQMDLTVFRRFFTMTDERTAVE